MNIFESHTLTSLILPAIHFLLLILCIAALTYYCFVIYAAVCALNNSQPFTSTFHPPVSILKPICGLDGDAYKNLVSFCRQDYPTYQIIFCLRDRLDPCIAIVKQITSDFPELDIELVICDRIIGVNPKVSNLANAVPFAKYEIILVADSDIRVGIDYLRRVIAPLQDNSVGVVTCMYRSIAQGWITTLEAVASTAITQCNIVASQKLEGIKFAFGSTIVIRQEVLKAIGGFSVIADHLADDYQLGYLPTQAGHKVVLSDYVVEHVLASSTFIDSIQRQIRWAKCIRVSRPWGYVGLIFTHGTAISLLMLIATGGSFLSINVLIATWTIRLIMGWIVGDKILQDTVIRKYFWLMYLSDFINFFIWCYSFFDNTVEWRGKSFKVIKEGKLILIKIV